MHSVGVNIFTTKYTETSFIYTQTKLVSKKPVI